MQEIISANFGGFNGLTKSAYAAQIEEIDRQLEEEKRIQFTTMDFNSKENFKMDSPGGPPENINESKSNFSQNTSMILPDIQRQRQGGNQSGDYRSPYNDRMFNNNKTQMLWKALGDDQARTISHLDQNSRLKYNEFDYVKRISVKDFMNEGKTKSFSEGRTSLVPLPAAPLH